MDKLSTEERFWAKVDKAGPVPAHAADLGPCWVWTGSGHGQGYGGFWDGRRRVAAHRFAIELADGRPIEPGMNGLHRCDNRRCVRRSHLFLGTQVENLADMTAKGRRRWGDGSGNGPAKVTPEQVRAIRAAYAAGGVTQRQLASEYGLSQMSVWSLLRSKTWAGVLTSAE